MESLSHPFLEESVRLLLEAHRHEHAETVVTHLREQLHQMEQEVLDAAAHEQARMAEELHDGLCQRLTTLSVMLATLQARLAHVDDAQAHTLLDRANNLTRQAIQETRSLAHSLYPAVLGEDGLAGALAGLARSIEEAHGLRCTFEMPTPVQFYDQSRGRHLYRIAQEASSNAIRHGLPSALAFRLDHADGVLTLTIENDGATIDPHVVEEGGGIGLRTMLRRASVMGGTLSVRARAPRGTIVTCHLPYVEPIE